jgi:hypothetical protein
MRLFACDVATNEAARIEQFNRTIGDCPYADADDAPESSANRTNPPIADRYRDEYCHASVTTRREFGHSTGDSLRRLLLVRLPQESLRHSRIRPPSDWGSSGRRFKSCQPDTFTSGDAATNRPPRDRKRLWMATRMATRSRSVRIGVNDFVPVGWVYRLCVPGWRCDYWKVDDWLLLRR